MAGARGRMHAVRPMPDPLALAPPSGPRRRVRVWLATLSITTLITSCGAQQSAAEKLIDPRLRSTGVLVERHGRALALGRYRVEQLRVEEEAFDGTGPLAADERGRTRPTQQLRLRFTLAGGTTPWSVECIGQRRQPPDHDLAAAADEGRDEIAVRCQLAGGEQRWVLRLDGTLASNLVGELVPAGADASAAKPVELLLWHQPWSIARRRLPASLALIRSGGGAGVDGGTEAALILDTPERAWLAPELDDRERELALAALLALRSLPLGWDG
jgi:hypothetical protein